MAEDSRKNEKYLTNEEISGMNISELKVYLRKHNQYVSGKKNELIERAKGVKKLDSVTSNDEEAVKFERRKTEKLVTPLGEKLPHPDSLKSWTNNLMEIPDFTERDIYNYFVLKMKTKKQLRAKVYYADKHVHSIQFHQVSDQCEHCFVKCRVMPSLPKANAKDNPDHFVWLCLSKISGQVHSAECDCTAGSGEACNHIGALMYALSDLTSQKKDGTIASTSKKCVWDQFNDPRKRKLTPKKSSELIFKKYKFNSENKSPKKKVVKELFKCSVSEERFRLKLQTLNPNAGWLLNFVENKKEPEEQIPQLLDINYNYRDSVDLKSENVQIEMQRIMESMLFTDAECETVEKLTRGQGKNVLWDDERKVRVTASNFGDVMSLKSDTVPEGPLKRMLYTNLKNKYVTWGIKHEPAARRKYLLTMKKNYPDIKVAECGLFVKNSAPYLGASPDGVITYTINGDTETGVLEIKCPASDKWRTLSPEECSKDQEFYCAIDSESGRQSIVI